MHEYKTYQIAGEMKTFTILMSNEPAIIPNLLLWNLVYSMTLINRLVKSETS